MPKPFDAALKDLFRDHAADFARLVGADILGPVHLLSPDLSAVSVESDIVLGVGDPLEYVFDINFQSTWDDQTLTRMLVYNVLLHRHTGVPVVSVAVLLRPIANDRRLAKGVRYGLRPSRLRFVPRVVRLWELPAEEFLTGGVGLLPLAILGSPPGGQTRAAALEATIRQINARLVTEVSAEQAAHLWTATFLLSGLHFRRGDVIDLFRGIRGMHESDTYQWIIDQGRAVGVAEEARGMVAILGRKKFGSCDPATRAALDAINDRERLERMAVAVLSAESWADVLRVP